jgi:hypothetical protein
MSNVSPSVWQHACPFGIPVTYWSREATAENGRWPSETPLKKAPVNLGCCLTIEAAVHGGGLA